MTQPRLDLWFLARACLAAVVAASGVVVLHDYQLARHARLQAARATAAQRLGDRAVAVAALSRAVRFDPANADAWARYGLALTEQASSQRERWQALKVLQTALGRAPGRPDLAVKAAETALALGEPAEALRRLAPVLREEPDRPGLHELAARAELTAGDAEGAARSLEQSLAQEPDRVSSAVLLADVLRTRLNRPRRAAAVLDRLVARNPRRPAALAARADSRAAAGDLAGARADLDQAVAVDPHSPNLRARAARLAWDRGECAAARAHWRVVLRYRPDAVEAYTGFARAARECGDAGDAVPLLREALLRQPGQPDLLFLLADLLLDAGQAAEAGRLRALLPQPWAAGRSLYLKGRLQMAQKRWAEAMRTLADASRQHDLSPENLRRLLFDLGRCAAALDARDDQLQAMRAGVKLDPTPSARLALARQLLAARLPDEAVGQLRPLAHLASPPPGAWLLLARALLEANQAKAAVQRRWAEAEHALDQVARSPAGAVAAALLRADMHLLRDEPQKAGAVLDAACAAHPDEPALWKARMDLALHQGDPDAAQALFAEADRRLGNRAGWLQVCVERLGGLPADQAAAETRRLGPAVARLPGADRDRLERLLAATAVRQGNAVAAGQLCAALLQRHPNDLPALQLLLDVKLAAGDDAAAARLTAQMRAVEGDEGVVWRGARAAWRLSQARRGDRGGLAEAARLVQEARRLRPGWSYAAFLEGRLADLAGKRAEALEAYRRVLQQGDYHPVAVRRLVQLLTADGRYADADGVLGVVQWHGQLDRTLLRPAAEVALRAGKPARAAALARLAAAAGPRSAGALTWLGGLLDAAGQTTEAEGALNEAVELAQGAVDPWLARLAYLTRHGRTADAEAALAEMQNEIPADRLPAALARAYAVMGRLEMAEKAYRRILAGEPRNAAVLASLLRLYVRTNQWDRAERLLHLLFDPTVLPPEESLPEFRRWLALALTAPDRSPPRLERALAVLAVNRAVEGETLADRRVAALARGRAPEMRMEALRTLEQLKAGPPMPAAERLRLAQLYQADGNGPAARTILLELLAADANNAALMAVLIDGLLAQGKKAEAAGWLARLEKLAPDAPRTQELRTRMRAGR
jgi:predicted Zn-dependent protease